MVLLFIGPSGSGKDTQAQLLSQKFQFERLSSGDLLRAISRGENTIQRYIREGMNEGFLSDNLVFGLLDMYLNNAKGRNFILTGFVRYSSQIALLDKAIEKSKQTLERVVYFDLKDDIAVERLSNRLFCGFCGANYNKISNPPKKPGICDVCGNKLFIREDDNPESIKLRLEAFHKDNQPILDEYKERNLLYRVDASQSIPDIQKHLIMDLNLLERFHI